MNDIDPSDLEKTLKLQLPQASDRNLRHFANMLAKPDAIPQQEIMASLLADGCDPNSLHAAILFGREKLIEKLPDSDRSTPPIHVLSRFDRMVSILMHLLVGGLESRLHTTEDRLSSQEQEALLIKAMVHWMRQGKIDLYNYFMEMPIKVQATVHDVHEQTLSVERSKSLVYTIAASEYGRSALTILPGSDRVLMLEVASVFRDRINFRHVRMSSQVRERRCHMRVQPDPPLDITIKITDGKILTGKALDYSENGMGLLINRKVSIHVEQTMDVDWMLFGKQMQSTAVVQWTQRNGNNLRIGVELIPNGDTRLELQQMVARTQRSIMSRLRMKGIPDALL